MPVVFVPSLMRDLTGGRTRVEVPGSNVRQVIESLDAAFPGAKARLCDGEGLNPLVAVAVDGELSTLGVRQPVGPASEVHFVAAVSGG